MNQQKVIQPETVHRDVAQHLEPWRHTPGVGAPRRVQGLDALRGVAVALVMVCHAWPQTFAGAGIVGVVIFFVLSGYLITGMLLRDIATVGRVRWTRFYMHRFFRLTPALALMLAGFATVSLITGRHPVTEVARSTAIGLGYLADLPRQVFEPVADLGHLWTLAVEEQFYLVWPLLLLLGVRTRRTGWVMTTCCGLTLLASAALPLATDLVTREVYRSPTSWAVALLLRAAARVYSVQLTYTARRPVAVAASAVLLAGSCFVPHLSGHPGLFLPLAPVMAAAAVVLVVEAEAHPVVNRGARPLVVLGTVSYAAYLWNAPLTLWLRPDSFENLSVVLGLALAALTVGCAAVSWFTVERLGRFARSRYDARGTSAPWTASDASDA